LTFGLFGGQFFMHNYAILIDGGFAKRNIVLVSGDSDFVPAMKFARREGALVYLVPLGQRVKPSMLEHSDLSIPLSSTCLAGIRAYKYSQASINETTPALN